MKNCCINVTHKYLFNFLNKNKLQSLWIYSKNTAKYINRPNGQKKGDIYMRLFFKLISLTFLANFISSHIRWYREVRPVFAKLF